MNLFLYGLWIANLFGTLGLLILHFFMLYTHNIVEGFFEMRLALIRLLKNLVGLHYPPHFDFGYSKK